MSKKKTFTVTVDDEHVSKIKQVVQDCKAVGMVVGNVLEMLGQITGEIEPDKKAALKKIRGVASVDESRQYQLPPPDSEIQ